MPSLTLEPTLPAAPTGPMAGLRILDLSAVVLGPVATQILGDYGADVIKVESLEGDLMRFNGVSRHRGMSSIYLTINRNKRSLAIDLKAAEGLAIIMRLAATADVFIHNMRVSAIERLGLGYEAVKRVKPDIVYCVATGYQEGGAYAGKPVFDDIVQAGCGLVDLNLRDANMPRYMPTLVADKAAGIIVAQAITAALLHHARTGQGQYVEVPMFESMTAFTLIEHAGGLSFDPEIEQPGYARIVKAGRRPIRVQDGYVTVLPYSPQNWSALFQRTDRLDLIDKYAGLDRSQVNSRVQELYADLEVLLGELSCEQCIALCEELSIPATRIYGLHELKEHPQLQSIGFFEKHEHPTEGSMVQTRPAVRFAQTPASIHRHAPSLGEHSREILEELGLNAQQVDSMISQGIVHAT